MIHRMLSVMYLEWDIEWEISMAVAIFTVLLTGFILGGSTVYLVENHLRTNEMNKKAEKFDLLVADLNKGGNTWFTKEEMTDDLNTVVYHGRLDVHEHSLPVFIVVDDSAFTYVRIAITTTSIDKKVIPAVLKELNTLNQDYKISKYYVSNEDNNIYMDVSIPCLNEQFDPTVVVNLMLEVIQPHLDAVHKDILKVAGLA